MLNVAPGRAEQAALLSATLLRAVPLHQEART